MSFSIDQTIINHSVVLHSNGGMSAEICFTKYIAFKRGLTYGGWNVKVNPATPGFVKNCIQYIVQQVKDLNTTHECALYGPGICSVPYFVETADMLYLPSHFLVGVTSLTDLKLLLEEANQQGYKCYAVIGYDGCLPNTLVAWIKFTEIPRDYIELLELCKVKYVYSISVFDHENKTLGEKLSRLIYRTNQDPKEQVFPGDMYLLYINEGYGQSQEIDNQIFSSIITDVESSKWEEVGKYPISSYITDWESGIDSLDSVLNPILNNYFCQAIYSNDTLKLYRIAYDLAKSFININKISHSGFVYNPYIISSPTYEMNYGYYPVLYWQGNPEHDIICNKITKYDEELNIPSNYDNIIGRVCENKLLTKWFNLYQGRSNKLITDSSIVIINSSPLCNELSIWITTHKKVYTNLYLCRDLLNNILTSSSLLH